MENIKACQEKIAIVWNETNRNSPILVSQALFGTVRQPIPHTHMPPQHFQNSM